MHLPVLLKRYKRKNTELWIITKSQKTKTFWLTKCITDVIINLNKNVFLI